MTRLNAVIALPEGLHARPAAELAKLVSGSGAEVQIGREDGPKVSAASMLGILSLGLRFGERVEVEIADSADEALAQEISALLQG